MKIKHIIINLFLLILGFFSLQSTDFSSYTFEWILEKEAEESLEYRVEIDFEKEKSLINDGGDGSGGVAILFDSLSFTIFHYVKPDFTKTVSKGLIQKPKLFILFCCLKIDC